MSLRGALAVLALGCGGTPAPPADCTSVAAGVKQYWAERRAETTDDYELAAIAESERLAVERFESHCRDDRWNPEMIACARAVFRLEDSGCLRYLSPQQKVKLQLPEGGAVPGGAVPGGIGIGAP